MVVQIIRMYFNRYIMVIGQLDRAKGDKNLIFLTDIEQKVLKKFHILTC